MVKKRSNPHTGKPDLVNVPRKPAPSPRQELLVSHFYWSQAEEPPWRTHTGVWEQRCPAEPRTAACNNPQPVWKQACPPPTELLTAAQHKGGGGSFIYISLVNKKRWKRFSAQLFLNLGLFGECGSLKPKSALASVVPLRRTLHTSWCN